MGHALGGAVLRLFKWGKMKASSPWEQQHIADRSGTCVNSPVQVLGSISFRDVVRLFFAWDTSSALAHEEIATRCATRFKHRFCTRSMRREGSDEDTFAGLRTRWTSQASQVFPSFPWAAIHQMPELPRVKCGMPGHLAQRNRLGSEARSVHHGGSQKALTVLAMPPMNPRSHWLVGRTKFPKPSVCTIALKWAKAWIPKGSLHSPRSNLHVEKV